MNVPTIIGLCVLGLILVGIIVKTVIDRKNGKGGCSCGCGGCANKSYCHPDKKEANESNNSSSDESASN